MVIANPAAAVVADKLDMLGAGTTVKFIPLLLTPAALTTTFPLIAPVGTSAAMEVALQLVTVATVPLKRTVLVPCAEPKFAPAIVTDTPTAPELGDRLVIVGDDT